MSYHQGHLSRILHDLGFTPQKPMHRAHDQEAVDEFRTTKWAPIKKVRKNQANSVLIDESGFMLQSLMRQTWAPVGNTPVMDAWDRHDRLTAITALTLASKTVRCHLYFKLLRHNANAEDFF